MVQQFDFALDKVAYVAQADDAMHLDSPEEIAFDTSDPMSFWLDGHQRFTRDQERFAWNVEILDDLRCADEYESALRALYGDAYAEAVLDANRNPDEHDFHSLPCSCGIYPGEEGDLEMEAYDADAINERILENQGWKEEQRFPSTGLFDL